MPQKLISRKSCDSVSSFPWSQQLFISHVGLSPFSFKIKYDVITFETVHINFAKSNYICFRRKDLSVEIYFKFSKTIQSLIPWALQNALPVDVLYFFDYVLMSVFSNLCCFLRARISCKLIYPSYSNIFVPDSKSPKTKIQTLFVSYLFFKSRPD